MPRRSISKIILVFLPWGVIVIALAIPIWWGIDARTSWDVDNIAPGSILKGMATQFRTGWFSNYGPLSYYLGALLYAPILVAFRLVGELGHPTSVYPWGFVHPGLAIGVLVVAARIMALAAAVGVIALSAKASEPDRAGRHWWLVPVLFFGSPVFGYYARSSNVDLHYLFWLWLALHLIERRYGDLRSLAAGSAVAVFAVCTKEQAAPIAMVLLVACVLRALQSSHRRWAVSMVCLAAVVSYSVLWQLPWNVSGWTGHYAYLVSTAMYPRTFPLTPLGLLQLGLRSVAMIPFALGWPVIAGVVLALLFRVGWKGLWLRALLCVSYVVFFIAVIGYVYPRFLLPFLMLAVPWAVRGYVGLFTALEGRRVATASVRAGALALMLSGTPLLSVAMCLDSRYAAEKWMRQNVPADALIEVAGNPHFQARISVGREVMRTKADSLKYTPRGPKGDVVLVSSIDSYTFESGNSEALAWWNRLHESGGQDGYVRLVSFRPSPVIHRYASLPVAPNIDLFVKAGMGTRR